MQVTKFNAMVLITVALASLIACGGQQARQNEVRSKGTRGIGEAYMRQGDYTAALAKLMEAEKLNPNDPIIQHDMGLCYRAKERIPEALAHLEKAVALRPSFSAARNSLGRVYLESGDLDRAIATLKELTKDALYATPHFPLSNLGLAYFKKQDYAIAETYYKQALKVKPDFVPALHGLGRTYVATAKGRLALAYLEKAMKIAPNVAQIHFDAAEAYEQMGRHEQAGVSYQTVIDLSALESELSRMAKLRLNAIRR